MIGWDYFFFETKCLISKLGISFLFCASPTSQSVSHYCIQPLISEAAAKPCITPMIDLFPEVTSERKVMMVNRYIAAGVSREWSSLFTFCSFRSWQVQQEGKEQGKQGSTFSPGSRQGLKLHLNKTIWFNDFLPRFFPSCFVAYCAVTGWCDV